MDPQIQAALVTLTVVVIGIATKFIQQWMNAKLKPGQFATVEGLARTAVTAAEAFKPAGVTMNNAEKLKFASDALVAGASRTGLKLKSVEVESFLHAALTDLRLAQDYQAQAKAVTV